MSRIAKQPVSFGKGIKVALDGQDVEVSGPMGSLKRTVNRRVTITQRDQSLVFGVRRDDDWPFAGTERALVNNMVVGVQKGFSKRLELVGVGYRAQMRGAILNLNLGYSHEINFRPPQGVEITTPSQTEVVVSGLDKQKIGQAAAEIRAFRPPEPYKGKGVKYADEVIVRKEVRKK